MDASSVCRTDTFLHTAWPFAMACDDVTVALAAFEAERPFTNMAKSKSVDFQAESRESPVGPNADREAMVTVIDDALRLYRFCEPERALIVQVVCDALLKPSPIKPESRPE
jgi:hypothetical protein